MADSELDVRRLRKPDKHPTISATYAAPAVGDQAVEVEAHGVGMHGELLGDGEDAHRSGRRPQ